jgi:hypothetical protein
MSHMWSISRHRNCKWCQFGDSCIQIDEIHLATNLCGRKSEQVDSISSYRARSLPAVPQKEIRTTINKILDATVTHTPNILPDMSKIDTQYPELSSFIRLYVCIGTKSPFYQTYRDLIQQIAAPDIVLQLVPVIAIAPLQQLKEQGDSTPNWLQSICPAFGAVVNVHIIGQCPVPNDVQNVAGWLAARAEDVYGRLAQHEPGPILQLTSEPWEKTGTYYGLPEIWKRRIYSKLRYDNHTLDRDAEEMGDCNKFYKTYSKNNLTGGILVLWCTHSVCLGFHSIPVAEGRNDVFSAIYT